MTNEIYMWLISNEQVFIDEISPDVSRIIDEMNMFSDVDLSEYMDGLKEIIRDYIEGVITTNFLLSPEDYLITKQDPKILSFITQLQTSLIRGKDGNTHTLH